MSAVCASSTGIKLKNEVTQSWNLWSRGQWSRPWGKNNFCQKCRCLFI